MTSSILTSPDCFDKQLTQQGQLHPYVVHFECRPNSGRAIPEKTCPMRVGCKIGGKIGQVNVPFPGFLKG